MDTSPLLLVKVGFLDAADPRFAATVTAVQTYSMVGLINSVIRLSILTQQSIGQTVKHSEL